MYDICSYANKKTKKLAFIDRVIGWGVTAGGDADVVANFDVGEVLSHAGVVHASGELAEHQEGTASIKSEVGAGISVGTKAVPTSQTILEGAIVESFIRARVLTTVHREGKVIEPKGHR